MIVTTGNALLVISHASVHFLCCRMTSLVLKNGFLCLYHLQHNLIIYLLLASIIATIRGIEKLALEVRRRLQISTLLFWFTKVQHMYRKTRTVSSRNLEFGGPRKVLVTKTSLSYAESLLVVVVLAAVWSCWIRVNIVARHLRPVFIILRI